jgi:hypothetical protein
MVAPTWSAWAAVLTKEAVVRPVPHWSVLFMLLVALTLRMETWAQLTIVTPGRDLRAKAAGAFCTGDTVECGGGVFQKTSVPASPHKPLVTHHSVTSRAGSCSVRTVYRVGLASRQALQSSLDC